MPRLESGFNLTSMTKASEICETSTKKKKAPTVVIVAYRVKELLSTSDQRTERVEQKTIR